MRILKKLGRLLIVLLSVIFIAGAVFVLHMKPDYDGEKKLTGLEKEVTV